MIQSITFKNFKALRDTTLPLGPLTLIVGPNGSGKSTALSSIPWVLNPNEISPIDRVRHNGPHSSRESRVEVSISWTTDTSRRVTNYIQGDSIGLRQWFTGRDEGCDPIQMRNFELVLGSFRSFQLEATAIAEIVDLKPNASLERTGKNLAGVLDRLRDNHPERFEALNTELQQWFPEFDRVLFTTPAQGKRAFQLRMAATGTPIAATDVSQGQLLALVLLTLSHLPTPPPIIALEEPDRGIHPRLLRDVRDALYRLAYPDQFGETSRPPVQVIATTHSPYFLELFHDHPEEIVIAQKSEHEVKFEALTSRPDIDEILEGAHLGDVWYSGVLGGVPSHT